MTKLVGILNITPDSFSDGDLYFDPEKAVRHIEKLITDGADIVDIGAESTRPGAEPITSEEEWRRLEPVIEWLSSLYPRRISLDTYHPETASKALAKRDFIINDVTGFTNSALIDVVVQHQTRCVVGHLPAKDIQSAHKAKPIEDIQQVVDELLEKAETIHAKGLEYDQIILDPGIGFGKSQALNEKLVEFARYVPEYEVMIGYSRKRFLGEHRLELEPNLETGRRAIAAGAAYLRVHDVAGHRQLLSA